MFRMQIHLWNKLGTKILLKNNASDAMKSIIIPYSHVCEVLDAACGSSEKNELKLKKRVTGAIRATSFNVLCMGES